MVQFSKLLKFSKNQKIKITKLLFKFFNHETDKTHEK